MMAVVPFGDDCCQSTEMCGALLGCPNRAKLGHADGGAQLLALVKLPVALSQAGREDWRSKPRHVCRRRVRKFRDARLVLLHRLQ